MTTVWILTEEYNQYDQYGEYFLAVFRQKPTEEELSAFVEGSSCVGGEWVTKLLATGGGRGISGNMYDWNWYFLREHNI